MNIDFTIISLIFLILSLPSLIIYFKNKNIFCLTHIIFVILFIGVLPIYNLVLTNEIGKNYNLISYILANFVWLLYIYIFSFFYRINYKFFSDSILINAGLKVSDWQIVTSFLLWIIFKLYLIEVYGENAFPNNRIYLNFVKLESWEFVLGSYLSALAVGAYFVYILKLLKIKQYWKNIYITIPFIMFLIPYLFGLESNIGSRRFVLLTVLLIVIIKIHEYGFRNFIFKQKFPLIIFLVTVYFFSSLYQLVRSNYHSIEFRAGINSSDIFTKIESIGFLFIPTQEQIDDQAETNILRDGPLRLTVELVDQIIVNNANSPFSEITLSGLKIIIPSFIYTNKVMIQSDQLISKNYNIHPDGDYINLDLPTSIPVIFLADYGLIGVILAPLLLAITFYFLYLMSTIGTNNKFPLILFIISWIFELTVAVESDITSIFSIYRDFIVLFILVIFFYPRIRKIK